MRLTFAQLNFTVGAFDANFVRIQGAVTRALADRADLVVFSELATTGYPPRDLLTHSQFVDRNLELLDRVAALSTADLAILIGFVDRNADEGKSLYNAVALCRHGRVVERRHKSLLPTYDVFDEDRYFEPARAVAPMDLDGARLGVTICEDVWNDKDVWPHRLYHREPVSELVADGANLLINISASPFSLDKVNVRRRLIRQDAVRHGKYFFYVNQVGGNDELVFDGHSIGFGPDGREVMRATEFGEDLITIEIPDAGAASSGVSGIIRPTSESDVEAAYRALVLGLGDYTRKCGFSSVVIGLSGGIDSAVTAVLAAEALGPENVMGVAMPTRYSSDHSLNDAEALARALGIGYQVIPIDAVFQSYLDILRPVLGPPTGTDSTEENVQARVRGATLMAMSNRRGSLLLTTGNKSELAVGYCTLYGDMCGGLAVISDVPKMLVYRLAAYMNRGRIIVPQSTISKAPSAELRPDQKDSDSLPPYEILDPIIAAYVEQNLGVDAIVALGFDRAVVADVIRRIDTSEYKRRQAAPGLKISSKAFGVGRRYPIAANYRY